jgi:hypothetical protein
MIEMVIGVILAGIVSDPLTVGVNVRSFRMPGLVGIVFCGSVVFRSFWSFLHSRWRRTVSRNVLLAANVTTPAAMWCSALLLRETRKRTNQQHRARTDQYLHANLLDIRQLR